MKFLAKIDTEGTILDVIVSDGSFIPSEGQWKPCDYWQGIGSNIKDPKPEYVLASEIRDERDKLLVELDEVVLNPLRFASFTDEQKAELATYRQALLDVPQQSGFPVEVAWPVRPEFI